MKLPLSLEILSAEEFAMDQGATGPPLRVKISDANGDVVPVHDKTVRLRIDGRQADGRIKTEEEEIVYYWRPEDTESPGEYNCQFVLRPGGGEVIRAPSYFPAKLKVYENV